MSCERAVEVEAIVNNLWPAEFCRLPAVHMSIPFGVTEVIPAQGVFVTMIRLMYWRHLHQLLCIQSLGLLSINQGFVVQGHGPLPGALALSGAHCAKCYS